MELSRKESSLLSFLAKKPVSFIKQRAQKYGLVKALLQKPDFWELLIRESFKKNYPGATEEDYEKLLNEYYKNNLTKKNHLYYHFLPRNQFLLLNKEHRKMKQLRVYYIGLIFGNY